MKRRKFIAITGLATLAAAFTSFKFITTPFEDAAFNLIKDELDFLALEDEGVRKFVRDFSRSKNRLYRITMKGYSFLGIRSSQSGKVNQLVSAYLLSSDFFVNKMDEKRVIKYVSLYDPYLRPCAHPFTHIHYPRADEATV